MQARLLHVPDVETHLISSKYVEQTYQIQVMQPLMRKGAADRFPVLYVTDGNLIFDTVKGISHGLQSAGDARRFILVGIGYPGQNPFAGNVLRARDLTAGYFPGKATIPRTSEIDGVEGIETGKPNWGGAHAFLRFIREELITFIDKTYPTIVGDRGFFGHSGGGELGLHSMFSQPEIFNRYLISSPGISYEGNEFVFHEAQGFIASGRALNAKVLMTVGDREEFEKTLEAWSIVSSFYKLAKLLRNASIPGLEFQSQVLPGETHMSAWPVSFIRGLRALYGPAVATPTELP
jgi:predicted alpha/beta superfamily hydrolase